MPLPTQAQVKSAAESAGTVAATAFAIFGLQAKGISLDQVIAAIGGLGTAVNDLVVLAGLLYPIYTSIKRFIRSSPTGQAEAIGANKKTLVNATPSGTVIVTMTDPAMGTAALEGQRKAS